MAIVPEKALGLFRQVSARVIEVRHYGGLDRLALHLALPMTFAGGLYMIWPMAGVVFRTVGFLVIAMASAPLIGDFLEWRDARREQTRTGEDEE